MLKSPRDTKGPVVKSGPTRGKNRSRTKGGRWRSKRSDSGKSRSKGGGGKKGCFLTTAACQWRGLPDNCHELEVMRAFRDDVLENSPEGREMIREYYTIAPSLVPLLIDPSVAQDVWNDLQHIVELVEQQDHLKAIEGYQRMVRKLAAIRR